MMVPVTAEGNAPAFSDTLGSMRGLAASVVVIYHGLMIARLGPIDDAHDLPLDWSDPWLLALHVLLGLFNGSAAVVLFFVLSGTVLALSLAREATLGPRELGAYYTKRLFRLMPLLAAVALVAAALHHAVFDDRTHAFATTWMNWHFRHDPGAGEVAANALGLSASLNSPAWTIFIEIVASVAFPALFVLAVPGRGRWIALALLSLLAFAPVSLRGVNMFMMCFFAGALIPDVGARVARTFRAWSRGARIASVAGALLVLGGFQRLWAPDAFVDPLTTLASTLAAAFLVTIVYFDPGARALRSRALLFLGEISYGLYLMHLPVLFVIAHAVAPLFPTPLEPMAAIALNLALGVATLALTVPLATMSYHALERPMQGWGRALARRVRTSGRVPATGLRGA